MPKYIVNSTGDQYFTPDSWRFYYDSLPGEKHLRYVPNTNHGVENSDAPFSLWSFYEMILNGRPRPRYDWKFEKDGAIRVRAQDKPSEVRLWQATNPRARDFRLESIGPAYKSAALEPGPDGAWVARVPAPPQGWTAWFVSLCLDVDVASQGRTAREARRMLAEAVALYLEGCFESNIPYLRPVPREQDPRFNQPDNFMGLFPLKVGFKVKAVA